MGQVMTSNSSAQQLRRTRRGPAPSWGHLQLVERIGGGAFGEVYRAFDPRLGREVALKVLRGSVPTAELQARVMRESRNLAKVRHPNVVAIHGAHASGRRTGYWMELIHGTTLAHVLRTQGPYAAEEAAVVGRELCRALSAVHHAGLVHGDIKAQNVMREGSGRVVLMDFGSSQCREQTRTAGEQLTGTLQYLAPEVLFGGAPSVAADIYGLGVLLFHLVTGEYPVLAKSIEELKRAHANGRVRRLTDFQRLLPQAFVTAVAGATSHVEARFRTAHDLLDALTRVRPPLPRAVDDLACGCPTQLSAALASSATTTLSLAKQTRTFVPR
jgi:eukaryotic-like serine/threonine-protein kinase